MIYHIKGSGNIKKGKKRELGFVNCWVNIKCYHIPCTFIVNSPPIICNKYLKNLQWNKFYFITTCITFQLTLIFHVTADSLSRMTLWNPRISPCVGHHKCPKSKSSSVHDTCLPGWFSAPLWHTWRCLWRTSCCAEHRILQWTRCLWWWMGLRSRSCIREHL